MTFPIVVTMLGHPRGKGRPRSMRTKDGRILVFTDPKTEEYESNLRVACQAAMEGRTLLAMALRVYIEAHFPIPGSWSKKRQREALIGLIRPTGKPDFDNIGKVCDACNGILWRDDAQIVEGAVVKRYSEKPLLRITVWPLTPAVETVADREKSAGRAPTYSNDLFAGLAP